MAEKTLKILSKFKNGFESINDRQMFDPLELSKFAEITKSLESRPVNLYSTARRSKNDTLSAKQIRKKRLKYKEEYHAARKDLSALKAEKEKLDSKINMLEDKMQTARKGMLEMGRALEGADLVGASHSVFYDSGDVGFVVDKNEYHLDINDLGECNLIDMKDYIKDKKENDKKEEDTNNADDFYNDWLKEFELAEV